MLLTDLEEKFCNNVKCVKNNVLFEHSSMKTYHYYFLFVLTTCATKFHVHVLNCTYIMFPTGFITMTPQLFINYKMKSVAHLPWRMLTYKALNTFIDDLFAFVIKMPMMYRIGCLRDGTI